MLFTRVFKVLLIAIIAFAFATVATAFAAANIVPGTAAGDGAAGITGFTVTNVAYQVSDANPSYVTQVSFTINPVPAVAKVRLYNAGALYDCAEGATTTCTIPAGTVTVTAANNLQVIAGDGITVP